MQWNPSERAALVDALITAGPDGPTLCEGWRSRHLAAHVVLRESTVLAAAGIAVPPLAGRTEQLTRSLGDRARTPDGYAALVERIRTGPPRWHPTGWAGDASQLVELFIHAEDVRRGGPQGDQVEPRERRPEQDAALWRGLVRLAGHLYRSSRPVVLEDGTGRRHVVGSLAKDPVVLRGAPGELLLHAYGRTAVAHVTLDGTAEALTTFHAARA